jgi:hypothetical protein
MTFRRETTIQHCDGGLPAGSIRAKRLMLRPALFLLIGLPLLMGGPCPQSTYTVGDANWYGAELWGCFRIVDTAGKPLRNIHVSLDNDQLGYHYDEFTNEAGEAHFYGLTANRPYEFRAFDPNGRYRDRSGQTTLEVVSCSGNCDETPRCHTVTMTLR